MTERWVMDCSAVAAVMLGEEDGNEAEAILQRANGGQIRIYVPALFWYEMPNVLLTGVKRNRLNSRQASELLAYLGDLQFETDTPTTSIVHRRTFDMALAHNLSAYDSAYLELADRLNASLKTFDRALLELKPQYPWIA